MTSGRLAAVQSVLARALADGGFYEPETRPFLAHVTVARVPREARLRPQELPAPEAMRFNGTTVTLFASRLGKGPARYEALASVTLRPADLRQLRLDPLLRGGAALDAGDQRVARAGAMVVAAVVEELGVDHRLLVLGQGDLDL